MPVGSKILSGIASRAMRATLCAVAVVGCLLLTSPNSFAQVSAPLTQVTQSQSVQGQAAQDQTAQASSTIRAIQITGNQRIDRESILTFMSLNVGDRFDSDLLNAALKRLIATSLFLDVTLQRQGDTLIVTVEEQKVINEISFEGNFQIDNEELLAEIQLRPRQPFTKSKIADDVRRILSLYQAQGRFATEVDAKIIFLRQNRINLVFEIVESNPSKILSINFVGNRTFSDLRLRQVVLSRENRIWRFINSMVNYDPARIPVDGELISNFYRDRGFADVKVLDSVAELTPDRSGFAVTFAIDEGIRYRVSDVKFEIDLPQFTEEMGRRNNRIRVGSYFSASKIRLSNERIVEYANERDIAFINVTPRVDRNEEKREVEVVFKIEEGERAFIERININGNEKTRDYVIRRRFAFEEGDAFNLTKLRRSQRSLQRLGFFSKVDVKPREGSAPDKVILDADLEETSTAAFQVGGQYSNLNGIGANVSLTQSNFLGRGQRLSVSASLAENDQSVTLGFTEPFFLGRDVAVGVSGGYTDKFVSSSDFSERSFSAGVSASYEIVNDLRQRVRYGFRAAEITPSSSASAIVSEEDSITFRSAISNSLTYDTRDSLTDPTEGVVASITNEFSGIGGDVTFVKNSGKLGYYYSFNDNFIFALESEAGWLIPLNEEGSFVSDRFQIGSAQVRGYTASGIGPVSSDAGGQRVGGTKFYRSAAELRFPVPLPTDLDIQARVFFDVGSLWDSNTEFGSSSASILNDTAEPRAAIGYGFTWVSPLGPLQLDFGYALNDQELDETQVFRFNISRGF